MSTPDSTFLEATSARRTFYALESKSTIPDTEIISLAERAVLTVPSAFNSQSSRLTLLFSAEHQKLWDIVAASLLAKIGEERFNAGTKDRIAGFKAAYGTVLFWDDQKIVEGLKKGPELYADKAEEWTHQSDGMHQYFMWVALEAAGLGVNLQHYNPLIDSEVRKTWGLPEHWNLKAQMVFGAKVKGSVPKAKEQKMEIGDRLKVFGAE